MPPSLAPVTQEQVPVDPTVEAMLKQAAAWERIADVGEQLIETFKPAAETVHGFGERLDKLCAWLRGKWPWVMGAGAMMLGRAINMAPEDVPKLIHGISDIVKALGG